MSESARRHHFLEDRRAEAPSNGDQPKIFAGKQASDARILCSRPPGTSPPIPMTLLHHLVLDISLSARRTSCRPAATDRTGLEERTYCNSRLDPHYFFFPGIRSRPFYLISLMKQFAK